MTEKYWSSIWHQAITNSFMDGKAFGRNKTAVFTITAPSDGEGLRLRFSNRLGWQPYVFPSVKISVSGRISRITMNGLENIVIPPEGISLSDPCVSVIRRGDTIQIRMFYTTDVLDSNMIEEDANLLKGDQTGTFTDEPLVKPGMAKLLGAYNAIPSLETVEILSEKPLKTIVAFGDSITALSQWTKPLAARLAENYPGEYALLNSGITGNCLLYEPGGLFGPVFGDKGVMRFRRDVLDLNPDIVIFGLGVNDVSYLTDKTRHIISRKAFIEAVTEMVNELHQRDIRVVMQTITPRLGVARTMGKYTREMEDLRLELNEWIRSADIFDYLFDAEAVVREQREDGYYYSEGLHQGDHLHPNAKGGRKLADAFDLEKLIGN